MRYLILLEMASADIALADALAGSANVNFLVRQCIGRCGPSSWHAAQPAALSRYLIEDRRRRCSVKDCEVS